MREQPVRLARRSTVMAAGTVLSRATGFGRVLALAYALGFNRLSDAYNLANTMPNIVYELVLGGVVSATVVPVFVALFDDEQEADPWRGVAAVTTLVLTVTIALSVLFAVAAPLLIAPYTALNDTATADDQRRVVIDLMRFFAPQVALLSGMAIGSAILNARRRFAAPMFAPVLNNVVAIGVLLALPHVIAEDAVRTLDLGSGLLLLGLGTTAGYAAQLLGLWPSLRAAGARLRPVWDLDHPAVRAVIRLSGWTVGFVIANQVAYAVVVALANRRSGHLSAYQAAFQFFQLPHAVVAVSITGALLPELSSASARGDRTAFLALLHRGLRVVGALLVPAALVTVVLARPIVDVLLNHGALDAGDARLTADVLAAFALGLPGFSAFLLCTRAFQARRDTRTVFYLYVVENSLNVLLAVVLYPGLGARGLAYAFACAYSLSAVGAYLLLRRPWALDEGRLPLRPSRPQIDHQHSAEGTQ